MRLGLASAGLASLAAAPIVLIACGGDAKSFLPERACLASVTHRR